MRKIYKINGIKYLKNLDFGYDIKKLYQAIYLKKRNT
jgi:hypothetical protein